MWVQLTTSRTTLLTTTPQRQLTTTSREPQSWALLALSEAETKSTSFGSRRSASCMGMASSLIKTSRSPGLNAVPTRASPRPWTPWAASTSKAMGSGSTAPRPWSTSGRPRLSESPTLSTRWLKLRLTPGRLYSCSNCLLLASAGRACASLEWYMRGAPMARAKRSLRLILTGLMNYTSRLRNWVIAWPKTTSAHSTTITRMSTKKLSTASGRQVSVTAHWTIWVCALNRVWGKLSKITIKRSNFTKWVLTKVMSMPWQTWVTFISSLQPKVCIPSHIKRLNRSWTKKSYTFSQPLGSEGLYSPMKITPRLFSSWPNSMRKATAWMSILNCLSHIMSVQLSKGCQRPIRRSHIISILSEI